MVYQAIIDGNILTFFTARGGVHNNYNSGTKNHARAPFWTGYLLNYYKDGNIIWLYT